ncbi:MAG: hypothetical protein D3904_11710 [Candidatus Electrothrix sp. EH2]|nr:hypothetical protein [Candidatus Electrothrix sp. EH2]
MQPEELADQRCFAFCGIARPESFQQNLNRLAVAPVAFRGLSDHFFYATKTVRRLISDARQAGATAFLCTEKDMVKLRIFDMQLPLYALVMEARPEKNFIDMILQYKFPCKLCA